MDIDRLSKVINRTVRGLYFHHQKQALPPDHMISSYCLHFTKHWSAATREDVLDAISPLAHVKEHQIGNETFTYRFTLDQHEPSVSVWFLRFYAGISFLALTVPPK